MHPFLGAPPKGGAFCLEKRGFYGIYAENNLLPVMWKESSHMGRKGEDKYNFKV